MTEQTLSNLLLVLAISVLSSFLVGTIHLAYKTRCEGNMSYYSSMPTKLYGFKTCIGRKNGELFQIGN